MEYKALHMNPRQVLRPVLDGSQAPRGSFNGQEREALKLKKELRHTPFRRQRLKRVKETTCIWREGGGETSKANPQQTGFQILQEGGQILFLEK